MDTSVETRVTLTPELHALLLHLLDDVSPSALGAELSSQLSQALKARRTLTAAADGADQGVAYDLVRRLGRWSQGEDGRAALRDAELDASSYHPHALLSVTHTLLPPSVTRPPAAPSNPDQPTSSPYLPPSVQAPQRAERSIGQDWADIGKQLGAVANVVFSAGGVAGGVYYLGGHGHKWSQTKSVLLALFAFFAVVAVEVALYAIHFSKLKRARADEARAKAKWLAGGLTTGVERVEIPVLEDAWEKGEEAGVQDVPGAKKERAAVVLRKRALGAPLVSHNDIS